ncbi:MAG: membrane dipeptidase [Burkholderiales bacterium]
MTAATASFHRSALVVDGLTPLYTLDEPYTQSLVEGGVDACLLSVASDASWDVVLQRVEMCLTKIEKSPLLVHARTAADIRAAKASGKVAMLFVTQASDMIEKDLKRVRIMYELGFRILGLCYTFANLMGDGCGERRNAGLSYLGKDLVAAVNELPMMLDLSHSGHQTSLEAAELAKSPCITHANAYAVNANDRNKNDEVLKLVAQKHGAIGLNALPRTVKNDDPALADMMVHLDHLIKVMGAEHVGLGLDYVEGFKKAGVVLPQSVRNRTLRPDIFGSVDDFLHQSYPKDLEDIRKLPNLTGAMAARGYDEAKMKWVLGESWLRAIEKNIG